MSTSSKAAAHVDLTFSRYSILLGCAGIDFTNTSDIYARFTTTVICNAIIQNSIQPCKLAAADSRPVCADTCVRATPFDCRPQSPADQTTRPNLHKPRHTSWLTVPSAPVLSAVHSHKSEPTSLTALYPTTHYPGETAFRA